MITFDKVGIVARRNFNAPYVKQVTYIVGKYSLSKCVLLNIYGWPIGEVRQETNSEGVSDLIFRGES